MTSQNSFSETKCEVFQADDKTNLLAHIWLPKKGKVKGVLIGIHGGMAHAGDWVTPALYFADKGFATYAPDLRWHGTYPRYNKNTKVYFHINSYDEYLNDIHKFIVWVKEKHPKVPLFIISHSNGALIALHYGLTRAKGMDISGFIVSSPWLKNKVEVPKAAMAVLGILSRLTPTLAIAPEPLTEKLTHDPVITKRHYADEALGLRGTKASVRLGAESIKTQEWVINNMGRWEKFPIFAVIAGQDHLADPQVSEHTLSKVPKKLIEVVTYDENFHENFNELNREKIYGQIWKWIQKKVK